MSTNDHPSSASPPTAAEPHGRRLGRRARLAAAVALAAVLGLGTAANAQDVRSGFELRPFVGAYIPTGDQRDLLESAVFTGAQVSWRAVPALAVTGAFGWSPNKDRIATGERRLDVYQLDIGAELRAPARSDAGAWDLTPFVGLGVGGRTYDYRDLNVDSKTNLAGYGAVGSDVGFGRVALRVELRDYVSRFEPLTGDGNTETRNDIGVAAGVAYRF